MFSEGGVGLGFRWFYELAVVTSRKDHECVCCAEVIPKKSRTLVENGRNKDEGFFSNYFHIGQGRDCHLDYLDACQPSDATIPDKLGNPEFFGQLMFNKWK